jgi:two-component system chemotaxis sensor kinase CheA
MLSMRSCGRFEQEPNNAMIVDNVFRVVHTIKGTGGFLGVPRQEAPAHVAETLTGNVRDGIPVTGETVTPILATIDHIKLLLNNLDRHQAERDDDSDFIAQLERAVRDSHAQTAPAVGASASFAARSAAPDGAPK